MAPYGLVMATLWLLLRRLCQPAESKLSAVPTALHISFQPLRSCLAYPGFNEQRAQCYQRDSWHHKQDEEQYKNVGITFSYFNKTLKDKGWLEKRPALPPSPS